MSYEDNNNRVRGLESEDIVQKEQVLRDHRTTGAKIWAWLVQREVTAVGLICGLVMAVIYYEVWELIVLVTCIYALLAQLSIHKLPRVPYLLPRFAPVKFDVNLPIPGTNRRKFSPPAGDVYLGVERKTHAQVWFTFKDVLTHLLATGSTGSGKSEFLVAWAYNCLSAGGSGLMFSDAKADPKVIYKISWMAKRFGREDCVLSVSYLQPEVRDTGKLDYQATNTSNPTQDGGAKEISNMLLSLLPANEGGSNASFADNAITLAKVMTDCFVNLRDKNRIDLSWSTFKEQLTLEGCLALAKNEYLDPEIRNNMDLFVHGISGVKRGEPAEKQSQTALDQFGYIASYLKRGLDTITNTFGYIYDCRHGDMSYPDVVHQKRILGTYLPALQNTEEEMDMLGKIDMAGKTYALSEGLDKKLEGTLSQINREKLFKGGVPTVNIIDEFQAAAGKTPGVEKFVTQGRSLGVATLIGVQSLAGLDVGENQDEFLENTKVKAMGRMEGDSTFETMNKIFGQEYISKTEGRTRENSLSGGALDKPTMAFEKEDRLNIQDMRDQIEGEFTIGIGARLIRMSSLFVETPYDTQRWAFDEQASIVFNSFVDLSPVNLDMVAATQRKNSTYRSIFNGELRPEIEFNKDLSIISKKMSGHPGYKGAILALVPSQADDAARYTAPQASSKVEPKIIGAVVSEVLDETTQKSIPTKEGEEYMNIAELGIPESQPQQMPIEYSAVTEEDRAEIAATQKKTSKFAPAKQRDLLHQLIGQEMVDVEEGPPGTPPAVASHTPQVLEEESSGSEGDGVEGEGPSASAMALQKSMRAERIQRESELAQKEKKEPDVGQTADMVGTIDAALMDNVIAGIEIRDRETQLEIHASEELLRLAKSMGIPEQDIDPALMEALTRNVMTRIRENAYTSEVIHSDEYIIRKLLEAQAGNNS